MRQLRTHWLDYQSSVQYMANMRHDMRGSDRASFTLHFSLKPWVSSALSIFRITNLKTPLHKYSSWRLGDMFAAPCSPTYPRRHQTSNGSIISANAFNIHTIKATGAAVSQRGWLIVTMTEFHVRLRGKLPPSKKTP